MRLGNEEYVFSLVVNSSLLASALVIIPYTNALTFPPLSQAVRSP
jgi:hypothetical protein